LLENFYQRLARFHLFLYLELLLFQWRNCYKFHNNFERRKKMTLQLDKPLNTLFELPITMQAAVVEAFSKPLALKQLALPMPGPGQVLIKVAACGVCHTDLHAAHGDWPVKPTPPFIPGHEAAGTVVALGAGVESVGLGDRVGVPWLHQACGHCEFCLTGRETLCLSQKDTGYSVNGGYAEYMLAAADYVAPIPAQLSFEEAAPVLCAGVTTYKALKVADVRPGQWVAIYGVGGLGHMAVEYAVAMGYKVAAIDTADDKLELARQVGAIEVVNSTKEDPAQALQTRLGGVQGAVITPASVTAFEQGVHSLKRGGTCVLVGLPPAAFPVDIFGMVLNGLTVRGSIVGTRADLHEALEFAAAGKVKAVFKTTRLSEINSIFAQMEAGTIQGRYVLTF
jgi:propanol-preferring alcohol dehydrogenase